MSTSVQITSSLEPSETTSAVVVCTHNGDRFIEEQLESIAAQTHAVDEIHIFDWDSRDDTLARIHEWTSRDTRRRNRTTIHAMRTAPGPSRSFLHALSYVAQNSGASLIFIADQDDLWVPDKVQTFVSEYQTGNGFDLAFSDVSVLVQSDGTRLGSFYGGGSPYRRPTGALDPTVLLTNPAIGMTMCVRRTWLEGVRPTLGFYWVMHDWALLVLCWLTASQLRYLDQPLVVYRQHEHNLLGASLVRPKLGRLRTLRSHISNLRRQLASAQEAARIVGSEAIRTEVAAMQGRWPQVRAAAGSPILRAEYRLLLAASLLVL